MCSENAFACSTRRRFSCMPDHEWRQLVWESWQQARKFHPKLKPRKKCASCLLANQAEKDEIACMRPQSSTKTCHDVSFDHTSLAMTTERSAMSWRCCVLTWARAQHSKSKCLISPKGPCKAQVADAPRPLQISMAALLIDHNVNPLNPPMFCAELS